ARRRRLLDRPPVHGGVAERGAGGGAPAELRGGLAHVDRSEQARQQAGAVATAPGGLVDAGAGVEDAEEAGRMVRRLRRADHEEAARIERVVEGRADLLLQLAVEIDEDVAAGDEVDAREGRVLEDVVEGEEDDVPQLLADPVAVA